MMRGYVEPLITAEPGGDVEDDEPADESG